MYKIKQNVYHDFLIILHYLYLSTIYNISTFLHQASTFDTFSAKYAI